MMAKELTTTSEDIGIDISDMMMIFMMIMMMSLMSQVIPAVTQQIQAQAYLGKTDPRTHKAGDVLNWIDLVHDYPHTPWISVYFVNDGPDAVEIAVNYPNDRFILGVKETVTVDRSGAQERIAIIFFRCSVGETASVRTTGEY